MAEAQRPVVMITGSAGNLGSALTAALKKDYSIVGCDRPGNPSDVEMDITSEESIAAAVETIQSTYGKRIAAVIHLAAYFDFTGEESPLYDKINVQGTRLLLDGLQALEVERFIYSSTMLVHQPAKPGERITEASEIAPKWAYPRSKAQTEKVIQEHHGKIPYAILRLAGLYSDTSAVPTLTHQIARIYEHSPKSVLYSGDLHAGQAFIHQDDMVDLFAAVISHRQQLAEDFVALAGEEDVMSYQDLQDDLGRLIHGEEKWRTLTVPEPAAKAGAWLEEKAETIVPDDFDRGEKPFIRPFMIDMASDHYALDISTAKKALQWRPKHSIKQALPRLVDTLLRDPAKFYQTNKLSMPLWMESAAEKKQNPNSLLEQYEHEYVAAHEKNIWAPFINIALGFWLLTSPWTLGYQSNAMIVSDSIAGVLVVILGFLSLSPEPWFRLSRWLIAAVGLWLLFAPLVFWAPTAASYLNDTLVGSLLMAFAILVRPLPGLSPAAVETGPVIPRGWDYSPSDWVQRLPIIALAFVGLLVSRYMAAYQLGHIDGVWEPFFGGALTDGKNGTEEIITSSVSEAWPVPDAGLGALVYLLEILTGIMGSRRRWRTMPWLVLLFGFMIVPLGAVSITFIIIQPILLNTWCTLCLIGAAAMLLQIPYSFDEIIATLGFLRRRARAGKPWMRVLFTGDTDEESDVRPRDETFRRAPVAIIKGMVSGGITFPWTLLVSGGIGLWLMGTRLTLGNSGGMANADHLVGALVLTVTVTAFAEVMRPIRFLNVILGAALLITPFAYGVSMLSLVVSIICGLALIGLSVPRGKIECRYGDWGKVIRV